MVTSVPPLPYFDALPDGIEVLAVDVEGERHISLLVGEETVILPPRAMPSLAHALLRAARLLDQRPESC